MEIAINEIGESFYHKFYKDTLYSIYVFGPLLFIFFCICFLLITGFTIKTLLILVFPIGLIYLSFYYSSFFKRGKIINQIIRRIRQQEDFIEIETFEWFYMKPKIYRIDKNNLNLKKSTKDVLNTKDCYVFNIPSFLPEEACYLIKSFFDGDVIKSFQYKME